MSVAARTLDVIDALEGDIARDGAASAGNEDQLVLHPEIAEARQ